MIDSFELSAEAAATPDLKRTRRRKDAAIDLSKIDRLPPHSLEAEQGTLGCLLIAPNEAIGVCVEKFKRGPETFYDLRHQTLYETLVEMSDRKEAIDLITVRQRLKDKGQLDAANHKTIDFSSTSCMDRGVANGSHVVDVTGALTIVGKSKTVTVPMEVSSDGTTLAARGRFTVLHSDFGIKPYTLLAGRFENKDELHFVVDIRGAR